MNAANENLPDTPKRVIAFVNFFKRYMSLSSVIVAALPIPITTFRLIPIYSTHVQLLSVLTPLFCFLTLGFVFYIRHVIAGSLFHDKRISAVAKMLTWLPLILIFLSLDAFGIYYFLLNQSITALISSPDQVSTIVLQNTEAQNIPSGLFLVLTYVLTFIFAEGSFVLMAVKEYLQDVLNLSEIDVIKSWSAG